jgi:aquaporin rerated protein, other eukaryote
VVVHSFEKYHWIYWVGPMAGSLLAVILFKLIKALEYESANPDPEVGPAPGIEESMTSGGRGNGRVVTGPVDGMARV